MNPRDDLPIGLFALALVLGAIAYREHREPRLLRYISSPYEIRRLRDKGYAVRRTRTATGKRAILRSALPVRAVRSRA